MLPFSFQVNPVLFGGGRVPALGPPGYRRPGRAPPLMGLCPKPRFCIGRERRSVAGAPSLSGLPPRTPLLHRERDGRSLALPPSLGSRPEPRFCIGRETVGR